MRFTFKNCTLLLTTILAAYFIFNYHSRAFPELSPEFSLDKNDVQKAAGSYAKKLSLHPENYYKAQSFHVNSNDKFFLELEYGLDQLQEEIEKGVKLWYWRTRYFTPGQQEEFSLELDTTGNFVGYKHVIPETRRLAPKTEDEARLIAEDFLSEFVSKHPLHELELIESGEDEKPGHLCRNFTWKRKDWKWGDGMYHLHITVSGDRVSHYSEHLKEPEVWQRDFEKKRSANELLGTIANTASFLLALGGLALFIRILVRNRSVMNDFPLNWTIPMGLILLVAAASRFPDILAAYPTQDNFQAFTTNKAGQLVFSSMGMLVSSLLIAFVADVLWHETFPKQIPVRALLSGRGLSTKQGLRSIPIAFALATLSLAYITIYYLLGRKIGIWTPSSLDNSQVLTSYLPSIEALAIGVKAAWSEEFFYRIVALILIFKLSRSKWLAIILSAVVWGFMHSNYPQMPSYARGIELTLEGIVLGWVALRYGILTTLLSHCLFNTWLGAIIAWRSGTPLHMGLALAVSVWPALLWFYGKWQVKRQGGYLTVEDLRPAARQVENKEVDDVPFISARPRLPKIKIMLASAITALALFVGFMYVPEQPLSSLGHLKIDRSQAEKAAHKLFQDDTGLDPASFIVTINHFAYLGGNNLDYVLETDANIEHLSENLKNLLYEDYWIIRYVRPEERNTYSVFLRDDGTPFILSRGIKESEPGAKLDRQEAERIAVEFLQQQLDLTESEYRQVGYDVAKRPDRLDHWISFISTDWQAGESRLQWTVNLQGDRVNNLYTWLRVPESYKRAKASRDWHTTISHLLKQLNNLLLLIGVIVLLAFLLKGQQLRWRPGLKFAAIPLLIALATTINQIPDFYQGYSTAQSVQNFIGNRLLIIFRVLLFSFVTGALLFSILTGLLRWHCGPDAGHELFGSNKNQIQRRFSEGVFLAILGYALITCVWLLGDASSLFISDRYMLSWDTFTVTGFSPALNSLLQSAGYAVNTSLQRGILIMVLIILSRKHKWLMGISIALLLLTEVDDFGTTGFELVHTISLNLLWTLTEVWILLRLLRFNPYGYFFFYFYLALSSSAINMTAKGWPAYSFDITILWGAILLPAIIALIAALSTIKEKGARLVKGSQQASLQ